MGERGSHLRLQPLIVAQEPDKRSYDSRAERYPPGIPKCLPSILPQPPSQLPCGLNSRLRHLTILLHRITAGEPTHRACDTAAQRPQSGLELVTRDSTALRRFINRGTSMLGNDRRRGTKGCTAWSRSGQHSAAQDVDDGEGTAAGGLDPRTVPQTALELALVPAMTTRS